MSGFGRLGGTEYFISVLALVSMMISGCSNKIENNDADLTHEQPIVSAVNLRSVFELNEIGSGAQLVPESANGKVIYLDFWASWCAPCVHSLPILNDVRNQYTDGTFELVSVNVDADRQKALALIEKLSLDFPVLYDSESVLMGEFEVTGLPTGLLFNSNSEIVLVHRGFTPADEKFLRARIDREVRRLRLHSSSGN